MDSHESIWYKYLQDFYSVGFKWSYFVWLLLFLDNKLVSYGNEKRFDIDRDYVKKENLGIKLKTH